LADENIVIFVGCQRKIAYFRRPNFVGGPMKIAFFDGIWSIFVGFWPTKISYFPVVGQAANVGNQSNSVREFWPGVPAACLRV
jgi:hypothetical protein